MFPENWLPSRSKHSKLARLPKDAGMIPVMLHCAKLIVWRPNNSAKLRDRKDVPFGPAARTKVWSCFFVAAEFERYSPTFLKTLECDFRANADPERGLPEPTASANASWSFPWLKCGVNA